MAGDWLKVEKDTPEKPEVLAIAAHLRRDPDDVFGKCFRFWRWADSQTTDGTLRGVTPEAIDALIRCENFSDALSKVGWLKIKKGEVRIPDFERHMGESAKQRALTAKRVARHKRHKTNGAVTQSALPREDIDKRRQEEDQMTMGNRKSSGNSLGPNAQPDEPMPLDARTGRGEGKFKLTDPQWDHVIAMAEAVARKIPPTNIKGRRCWFKYAVLAEVKFGEGWLMDAVAGVVAGKTNGSIQGHFVSILKGNAEERFDVDPAEWIALMERAEIPPHIWKSGHLEIES